MHHPHIYPSFSHIKHNRIAPLTIELHNPYAPIALRLIVSHCNLFNSSAAFFLPCMDTGQAASIAECSSSLPRKRRQLTHFFVLAEQSFLSCPPSPPSPHSEQVAVAQWDEIGKFLDISHTLVYTIVSDSYFVKVYTLVNTNYTKTVL